MVIRHNLAELSAANTIKYNGLSWQKSAEKLSSGYRINRAADDAAGLTISEKLRSQIRGLNQAADNIQDGISMTNVADGALSEVADMLHRQTELLIKASNGTNTTADRVACQSEISQLSCEIERIFSSTTFNEHELFKGKDIIIKEYDTNSSETINSPTIYEDNTGKEGTVTESPVKSFTSSETPLGVDKYGRPSYRLTNSEITTTTTTVRKTSETDISSKIDTKSHVKEHMPEYIMIQSGPQTGDAMAIRLYNLSISEYGMDELDATTSSSSLASLVTVDGFLDRINEIRSYYGAATNRMEHAYNIDLNTAENTQAAESQIRDTDMAKEVVNASKLSILGQATQSVLAQANQSRSMILQLL